MAEDDRRGIFDLAAPFDDAVNRRDISFSPSEDRAGGAPVWLQGEIV